METKQITDSMREYAARIVAPKGWKREEVEGKFINSIQREEWDTPGMLTVILTSPAIVLIFRLVMTLKWSKGKKVGEKVSYNGSTLFKKGEQWYSFDQRGVSDSFYSPYDGELPDPATVIEEQRQVVIDYLAADATKVDVPSFPGFTGFRVTPQEKEQQIKKLNEGKVIVFTPAGFGIGYQFGTKQPRTRAKRVPQELADFYGVPVLWYQTFDHD